MSPHCRITAILIVFCISVSVHADPVGIVTLDGTRYSDSYALCKDGIEVVAAGRDGVRFSASKILHADLGAAVVPTAPAVVLTSGEVLSLADIPRMDQTGIVCLPRLRPTPLFVSAEKVARVITVGEAFQLTDRIPTGQSGALLKNGDFFQGEVQQLDVNHVRVSSILFGIQNFDCRKQVIAVAFHDAARPDGTRSGATWIARTIDGSVLLLRKLNCAPDEWVVNDAELGPLRFGMSNLSTIDAGGSLVTSMADRPPDESPPGAYMPDRTTPGVPMKLTGVEVHRGVGQQGNSSISWKIDGKFQSFIARAGVPAGLLPVAKIYVSVLADGRQIYRSPALCSVDESATVVVGLSGVKVLTLRVEKAETVKTNSTVSCIWADPICVDASSTAK